MSENKSIEERLAALESRVKSWEELLNENVVAGVNEALQSVERTRTDITEEHLSNRAAHEKSASELNARFDAALKSLNDEEREGIQRFREVVAKAIVSSEVRNFLIAELRNAVGATVLKVRPATQVEITNGDPSIIKTQAVSR